MARDVLDLCDQLAVQRIVGHSLGGRVALAARRGAFVGTAGPAAATAAAPALAAAAVSVAAILGIGRASLEGVYKDGEFAPHLMMPMSLSYDHRVIDGADGARFTVALKSTLESPLSLTELSESS